MRASYLLPLLLTLACSEYGFGVPRDHAAGAPDDDASDPTDPQDPGPGEGDTGSELPPPPDCDGLAHPTLQRVPWPGAVLEDEAHRALDFDADGQMIGLRDLAPWNAPELVRYGPLGDLELLGPSLSMTPWESDVRTLADGGIAWVSSQSSVDFVDPYGHIGSVALSSDYLSLEPQLDGTFLVKGWSALDRVEPSTGKSERITEAWVHPDEPHAYALDIALSPSEDTLNVLFKAPDKLSIVAFPYDGERLGDPTVRLPPTPLSLADDGGWGTWWARNPRHQLAVDACENLYLMTGDRIWKVSNDATHATPVVVLPTELMDYYTSMFWGHDAGYGDPQALYITGYEHVGAADEYRPVRYAIHLGVDGNHVLSR